MSGYLAPGVYVEETSFRSKSIEGVSTSTAGFVGPALWGPICGDPELLTSFADFERIYGGLDDLNFTEGQTPNYLAHGVRAFFEEGGQRLYVSRVFNSAGAVFTATLDDHTKLPTANYATAATDDPDITLVTRFPGKAGNMRVFFTLKAGTNSLVSASKPTAVDANAGVFVGLTQVQSFSLVHIRTAEKDDKGKITRWHPYPFTTGSPPSSPPGAADGLFLAYWNTKDKSEPQPYWELIGADGMPVRLEHLLPDTQVRPLTVLVEVAYPTVSTQGLPGFKTPILLGEFGFDVRNAN